MRASWTRRRSTPRPSASASVVHVKDQKSGDSRKFQIVGPTEANPAEQKLSHESPIGKALLGHKRGDLVTVDVPRGPKKKLKITKIEAA